MYADDQVCLSSLEGDAQPFQLIIYALQAARRAAGTRTIFVCGTPQMLSRSLSILSHLDGELCPVTLTIAAHGMSNSIEAFNQAASRGCGNVQQALERLGQTCGQLIATQSVSAAG